MLAGGLRTGTFQLVDERLHFHLLVHDNRNIATNRREFRHLGRYRQGALHQRFSFDFEQNRRVRQIVLLPAARMQVTDPANRAAVDFDPGAAPRMQRRMFRFHETRHGRREQRFHVTFCVEEIDAA